VRGRRPCLRSPDVFWVRLASLSRAVALQVRDGEALGQP
jgi:hypothetical protein